jgi:hypothetical protein
MAGATWQRLTLASGCTVIMRYHLGFSVVLYDRLNMVYHWYGNPVTLIPRITDPVSRDTCLRARTTLCTLLIPM